MSYAGPRERLLKRPAMARTLGYLYLAGASLALASLALPHDPRTQVAPILAIVVVGYVVGVVLRSWGSRMPGQVVPALLAFGSLLITACVHFDGEVSSVYAFLYVWVGVEAFYFLPLRQALVQLAIAAAGYAWALTTVPPDEAAQHWLLTIGTAVVIGILMGQQRGEVDRLVARLSDAARTDPLTDLLNRRAFEELFDLELERARRSGARLSLVVGDLDNFKLVNDRLGHQAGDDALVLLARDIARWKRRIDGAGRIGGEEFALLLPETDERGAFLVAERLRRSVHRTFGDHPRPLTISFGVATYPEHGERSDELLRAADQALYSAKRMGKDRTVIYSPELAHLLTAEAAAERGELQLATVVGLAEALDIRDTGSARHCQTVGRYARAVAEELGLDPARVERVQIAGVLHDVGKIAVSDRLLTKPGPLSRAEWAEVRTHPEIAARLLSRPEFADLHDWILAHHERPDGKGYPRGLAGDDIPLESAILAVADAYEAMTADRVYSPALAEEAARAELIAGAGRQFDDGVVKAFLRALDRQQQLAAA